MPAANAGLDTDGGPRQSLRPAQLEVAFFQHFRLHPRSYDLRFHNATLPPIHMPLRPAMRPSAWINPCSHLRLRGRLLAGFAACTVFGLYLGHRRQWKRYEDRPAGAWDSARRDFHDAAPVRHSVECSVRIRQLAASVGEAEGSANTGAAPSDCERLANAPGAGGPERTRAFAAVRELLAAHASLREAQQEVERCRVACENLIASLTPTIRPTGTGNDQTTAAQLDVTLSRLQAASTTSQQGIVADLQILSEQARTAQSTAQAAMTMLCHLHQLKSVLEGQPVTDPTAPVAECQEVVAGLIENIQQSPVAMTGAEEGQASRQPCNGCPRLPTRCCRPGKTCAQRPTGTTRHRHTVADGCGCRGRSIGLCGSYVLPTTDVINIGIMDVELPMTLSTTLAEIHERSTMMRTRRAAAELRLSSAMSELNEALQAVETQVTELAAATAATAAAASQASRDSITKRVATFSQDSRNEVQQFAAANQTSATEQVTQLSHDASETLRSYATTFAQWQAAERKAQTAQETVRRASHNATGQLAAWDASLLALLKTIDDTATGLAEATGDVGRSTPEHAVGARLRDRLRDPGHWLRHLPVADASDPSDGEPLAGNCRRRSGSDETTGDFSYGRTG